jgi:hypothetical protein
MGTENARTFDVIARNVSNKLAEEHYSRMCHGVARARVHEFNIKYRIVTDVAQLRDVCTA